jgi:hypothetical protein
MDGRNLNDPEFVKVFLRILSYNLNGREIKYLLCRFYFRMGDNEIVKFDGRKITRKAVNFIIQGALKKIRQDFRKSHCIL